MSASRHTNNVAIMYVYTVRERTVGVRVCVCMCVCVCVEGGGGVVGYPPNWILFSLASYYCTMEELEETDRQWKKSS